MRVHEFRAGGFIFRVRITRADARAALDHDRVAAFDELIRTAGQQRHAILLLLDFLGNADGHGKFEF